MNLATLGFKWIPRLPGGLVRGAAWVAGGIVGRGNSKAVRQLSANLARVRPELSPRARKRLTRQAMRYYLRYFCEAFQIAKWPFAKVLRMVRLANEEQVKSWFADDPRIILVLAHMGNWDLAGAWATRQIAPLTTVAERVKPEELFEDFLAMRQAIGLNIIPLDPGRPVFRDLLRVADSADPWVVALLADRDLGRGGVEVQFFGEPALMAPGPAALAVATGRPLYPVAMYREGRHYVLDFAEAVKVPADLPKEERIRAMTQAWATALEDAIRRHPADWHMMQKVFIADLDPQRLAQVRGGA